MNTYTNIGKFIGSKFSIYRQQFTFENGSLEIFLGTNCNDYWKESTNTDHFKNFNGSIYEKCDWDAFKNKNIKSLIISNNSPKEYGSVIFLADDHCYYQIIYEHIHNEYCQGSFAYSATFSSEPNY